MDTFGPVSDNAQGIAEMSGEVEGEAAQVLTKLDAVGNTTKAITKGIAIATAVLAATALFGAFRTQVTAELLIKHLGGFSLGIDAPNDLFGLIIGASVVFFFAGLLIMAVGRAAGRVVVRGPGSVPRLTRASWTTPRSRSTAAWWTSAPGTRCVSWRRPACWRC